MPLVITYLCSIEIFQRFKGTLQKLVQAAWLQTTNCAIVITYYVALEYSNTYQKLVQAAIT